MSRSALGEDEPLYMDMLGDGVSHPMNTPFQSAGHRVRRVLRWIRREGRHWYASDYFKSPPDSWVLEARLMGLPADVIVSLDRCLQCGAREPVFQWLKGDRKLVERK